MNVALPEPITLDAVGAAVGDKIKLNRADVVLQYKDGDDMITICDEGDVADWLAADVNVLYISKG